MSIQWPSCFFNLCSSCSSRSNKRRRDCLLPPPCDRLCCCAGLTARPYSHRWTSHPSTHPHLLLFSGNGRRTSKPSYSPPHGKQLSSLPWLHVVPFLGLAVVYCPGALGVAWSTWSMNDIHQKWTVCGQADSWVQAAARECLLITRKIIIPPPESRDPPDGPPYFTEKTFPPLSARTH